MTTARRWAWATGAMACALAFSGCSSKAEKKAQADAAPRAVPVTVAPVRHVAVERTVPMVGTLKGWEEVTVGSKKAGRVVRFLADIGDRVKPGTPLVEVDPVDADLAILQAESTYLGELTRLGITRKEAEEYLVKYGVKEEILRGEQANAMINRTPAVQQTQVAVERAQQNLARQRQLSARNAGTLQELQNMENDLRTAEAQRDNAIYTARNVIANAIASRLKLDVAKQARADMTIRAPVPTHAAKELEGRGDLAYAVSRRTVTEGQMLREGDPVYDLVIENPLRLWSNVPERFASDIKVGQPVRFSVASRQGETFEGSVTRVNPTIDPVSRTFQVEASVRNDGGLLHPGGFVKASILTQRDSEATVVPRESVVHFAGVTKVFVVEDKGGKPSSRAINVTTGQESSGTIEVIGELPGNAKVVTTGQTQLADGTPVIVREPLKPRAAEPAGKK